MNFNTMEQSEVPQGRNGKHKEIVTRILSDLDQLRTARPSRYLWTAVGGEQRKGSVGAESRDA